jgi:hypothetical protein
MAPPMNPLKISDERNVGRARRLSRKPVLRLFTDALTPCLPSPGTASHTFGIRQIGNRHRAPAAMRYSDPGIVPFGKLSQ